MKSLARSWVILAVIVFWELVTRRLEDTDFPPPTTIVSRMYELWFSGPAARLFLTDDAMANILPSLGRMFSGWILASLIGVVLGVLLGRSQVATDYVSALIEFGRAIPPPLLLPLFLVLFQAGLQMQLAAIVSGVIWPVLLNSMDGARAVDRTYTETAIVFGLSRAQRLGRIVIPAASPKIFAGLRLSLSLALILMVISEVFGSTDGIGYQLLRGTAQLRHRCAVPAEFVSLARRLGRKYARNLKGNRLRQKLCWRFQVANDPAVGRFLVAMAMPWSACGNGWRCKNGLSPIAISTLCAIGGRTPNWFWRECGAVSLECCRICTRWPRVINRRPKKRPTWINGSCGNAYGTRSSGACSCMTAATAAPAARPGRLPIRPAMFTSVKTSSPSAAVNRSIGWRHGSNVIPGYGSRSDHRLTCRPKTTTEPVVATRGCRWVILLEELAAAAGVKGGWRQFRQLFGKCRRRALGRRLDLWSDVLRRCRRRDRRRRRKLGRANWRRGKLAGPLLAKKEQGDEQDQDHPDDETKLRVVRHERLFSARIPCVARL